MANTWTSDWELVTKDWDPVADADKFDAIARLFHSAHYEGRLAESARKPVSRLPVYRVPALESITGGGDTG